MQAVNQLQFVRILCEADFQERGIIPTRLLLDQLVRTVCDNTYNPRRVPSLLGPAILAPRYVCLVDADAEKSDDVFLWATDLL